MFNFLFASLMGALLIAIVMLLRKVTREKYRSRMVMILWGIVLLRLLIPFNPLGEHTPVTLSVPERNVIEALAKQSASIASPAEQANKLNIDVEIREAAEQIVEIGALAGQVNKSNVPAVVGNPAEEQGQLQTEASSNEFETVGTLSGFFHKLVSLLEQSPLERLLLYIWFTGTLVSILYLVFVRIVFMRTIHKDIVRLEDEGILKLVPANMHVFVAGKQIGPLVVGLLKPYLIIPRSLLEKKDENELRKLQYAIRHEVLHIRRKDLWVKALYLIARSIHWFNPLVWLMGGMLNQDIEYACDEALISELNKQEKVDYCQALLDLARIAYEKPNNFSSRLMGGADMLKSRIHKIVHNPLLKRGRTIALSLALIMVVSLIVVSCNPEIQDSTSASQDVSTITPSNEEVTEPEASNNELDSVKPGTSKNESEPSEPSAKDTHPNQSGLDVNQSTGFYPGYWYGDNVTECDRKIEFLFTDDGKYKIDRQTSMLPYKLYGTYSLEGDSVTLTSNGDDGLLTFKIEGDKLVLMEQDLISTLFPDNYTLERGDYSSRVVFLPEEEEEFSTPVFFRDPQAFLAKPDILVKPHHFSYPDPVRMIGSILYFVDYKGFYGFDLEKHTMVHAVQITDPNFPTATQGDYMRTINISKDGKYLLLMPLFSQFRNSKFPNLTTWGFVRAYWYEYNLETQTLERNTSSYDELMANIKERGNDEKDLWQQYEWKSDTTPTSYQEAILIGPDGKTYKPFEHFLPDKFSE